jgi:exodeoxyribonuclease VII small subunit
MDQKTGRKAKSKPISSGEETDLSAISFEAAMEQLEGIVGALENGELPIADALAAYQRGAQLMRHAQAILNHVQTEIEVVESGKISAVDRDRLIAQIKE